MSTENKNEQLYNESKQTVDQAVNNVQQDAKAAAEKAENTAEKLAEESRNAANKVSDFVHKEAEEIEERAKKAGKSVSHCISETADILRNKWNGFSSRPVCWIPVLSAVNVALIGAAGFFGYKNRSTVESWDKRILAAIAVGAATLLGGESFLAVTAAKKQCKNCKGKDAQENGAEK